MSSESSVLDWQYHEPYAFLDSGVPEGSDDNYTTWVMLHGTAWNSPIFRKLLPLARQSGHVRIIAPNRADYPGSRALDANEVAMLNRQSSQAGRGSYAYAIDGFREFLEIQAFETLRWCSSLILNGIVRRRGENEGRSGGVAAKGGLVVIGWSAGNHILLSILANLSRFPPDMVENLHEYVVDMVIYDCPGAVILGYDPHPKFYSPTQDNTISPSGKIATFTKWVTGYYGHQAVFKRNYQSNLYADSDYSSDSEPSEATYEELESACDILSTVNITNLEFRSFSSDPPPTFITMSVEELETNLDQSVMAAGRAEAQLLSATQVGYAQMQRRQALFGDGFGYGGFGMVGEKKENVLWEDIPVTVVWGDKSLGDVLYGAYSLAAEIEEAFKNEQHVRDVKFVRLAEANHYAHWDMPLQMFETLERNVGQRRS